ncbi:MAG: hemerythrin domain-containing protein [Gammaproteobacteria bacterium]|nr:hemerythrin domain-containing protein [Gammaproteobacteria bacterium]
MKVADELLTLTREHHQSLSLGNNAVNVHKAGDEAKIKTLCLKIAQTFKPAYKKHFETEEQTIFALLKDKSSDLNVLCTQLKNQHQQLYQLAEDLPSQPELLLEFGTLLKTHTRTEDRVLFPNITLLTNEQRQAIKTASKQHNTLNKI